MLRHSSKYYRNQDCEFFPCHQISVETDFNCLFCYCPLYPMGESCCGVFTYNEKGVKDCAGCQLPHAPEYYEVINQKLRRQLPQNTRNRKDKTGKI